MIIFPGAGIPKGVWKDLPSGVWYALWPTLHLLVISLHTHRLAASENGYMDQELGLHFIKAFNEMTSSHADPNFPHILHFDCHTSHVALNFLQYAKEHKIIVMGYVPHIMHLCQGLDVVLFSPHKCAFAEEHKKHEQETGQTLECAGSVVVNHWAVICVFTPSKILAAFCKTGI